MMKRDALIVSHFKLFLSNLRTVSSVSVYVSSVKIRARPLGILASGLHRYELLTHRFY